MNLEDGSGGGSSQAPISEVTAAATLSALSHCLFNVLQLLRDAAIGIPGSGVSRTAGRRAPNSLALEILSNKKSSWAESVFPGCRISNLSPSKYLITQSKRGAGIQKTALKEGLKGQRQGCNWWDGLETHHIRRY